MANEDEKDIKQMVSEMHKALIGDEYRKEGIVHKVEKHEQKLQKHDNCIIAITGGFLVVTFILKFGDKLMQLIK